MTSPVVTRLLISSPSSTSLSSMKVRSSLAATEPLSMTPRRSSSEPASVPEKAARFWAKVRIALSLATWPRSTTLLSRISAVVTSKFALASSMKALPVSMIWPRSSPVPAKALPNSSTVVFSAFLSTDSTVSERLVSRVWVWIGVRVFSTAISLSSSRKGCSSVCGCSSTYCSPTADRLPTSAIASAGMESKPSSMPSWTSTPSSVSSMLSTCPTFTPR